MLAFTRLSRINGQALHTIARDKTVMREYAHRLAFCRNPRAKGPELDGALTQSIETTPYYPDAYMTRSIACVGLGRPDTALDDVTKALELDPRNRQARSFALAIWEVAERRTAHELTNLSRLDTQRARSAELLRRYGIKPSE